MHAKGRFLSESLAVSARFLLTDMGPDSRENIHTIVRKVSHLLECDSAAYACIETASGGIRFWAPHKLPPRHSSAREAARRICSEIIAGKRAGCISETALSEESATRKGRKPAKAAFSSFLGCPVSINGKKAGALVAFHTRSRRFSEEDRELIALLAGLVAIEHARHERNERLRRRLFLEKMLTDFSTRAIAIKDAPAFIAHGLAMVGTRMDVGGAFLGRFDPRKKSLRIAHEWISEGQSPQKPHLQDNPTDSLPWAVSRLRKGEILKVDDASLIPAEAERKFLGQIGVHACLAIPLFSKDAFYGFIGLACCRGPRLWLAEEVLVLQTAAEIMMRCIENSTLPRG